MTFVQFKRTISALFKPSFGLFRYSMYPIVENDLRKDCKEELQMYNETSGLIGNKTDETYSQRHECSGTQ